MPAAPARRLWWLMNPEAVSEIELRIAAERKASQHAPPPAVAPHVGGVYGAIVAVGVIALVSNLARIELGDIPILVTVAISAALPILHFSSQEKRHRKATLAEFERLKKLNNR